ncbi:SUMO1 sentrin specific peptidase 1, partial [Rhizoclosmatium hyalinum]
MPKARTAEPEHWTQILPLLDQTSQRHKLTTIAKLLREHLDIKGNIGRLKATAIKDYYEKLYRKRQSQSDQSRNIQQQSLLRDGTYVLVAKGKMSLYVDDIPQSYPPEEYTLERVVDNIGQTVWELRSGPSQRLLNDAGLIIKSDERIIRLPMSDRKVIYLYCIQTFDLSVFENKMLEARTEDESRVLSEQKTMHSKREHAESTDLVEPTVSLEHELLIAEPLSSVAQENKEVEFVRTGLPIVLKSMKAELAVPDTFPPFDNTQSNKIKECLTMGHKSDIIVPGYEIKRVDIQTLKPNQRLNDEIINMYLDLIIQRQTLAGVKIQYLNTFFLPKLLKEGVEGVGRWTKKYNIFELEYMLIPVFHNGNH